MRYDDDLGHGIIRTVVGLLAGAAFALAATGGGGAALASTGADVDAASSDGPTCWVSLDTAESVCVVYGADLIAAVAAETGIVLEVPDGAIIDDRVYEDGQPTASAQATPAAAAAASTIVGILYDDVSYGGGSLVLSASGSCGTYGFADLGGYGWNDRASSYRTYAGCRGTAYQNTNYGGTATATTANAAQLGSMNDRASSFRVTR